VPDEPRRLHYFFAHRELPSAAYRFGADLVAAARDGRLTLGSVWDRVGEELEDPRPSDGLDVAYHAIDGYGILLVTLPAPAAPTEAHFAAIVLSTVDGAVRYFTLEDAYSPVDGSRYTVLGSWTEEGSHVNLGPGPLPRAELFLAALQRLMSHTRGA
jgi:hypothetical protein